MDAEDNGHGSAVANNSTVVDADVSLRMDSGPDQNHLNHHHHTGKSQQQLQQPPPPPPQMLANFDNNKVDEDDFFCGIFRWHPPCLQRFANKKCFLALFCLTSVLQGIYYTYFVSVLTTIEKLYQVQSRTTGIIMSSTEIGQISGALLLTYYGGQGHRPRWIATGMLVFAFAALLCSTPHYIFGSQPVFQRDTTTTTATTLEMASSLCTPNTTMDAAVCNQESEIVIHRSRVTNYVLGIFFLSLLMIGLGTTAVNTLGIPYIDDNVAPKESPLYFGITIGVRIFGPVCGFLLGSVCTSIPVQFPFGTFDHLSPNDPNWIGAWWLGLFLVGVSLALAAIPMMVFPRRLPKPDPSSYCHQQQQQSLLEQQEKLIKLLNDHNHHPPPPPPPHHHHLNHSKGLNNCSELNNTEMVTFCDPSSNINNSTITTTTAELDVDLVKKKNQSKHDHDHHTESNDSPTFRGFSRALKRLLSNDILLCRTASSVLHILPIAGLYTFLPKYLESQFQLTAGNANMIAGLGGILVMGIGIFASGTFMRKFNPSARFVAQWIAFAALSYVFGMAMLMFLGCPNNQFAGFKNHDDISGINHFVTTNNEKLECSAHCQCQSRFEPICMQDGITYMSPCLAGCTTTVQNGTNNKYYVDCGCFNHQNQTANNHNHNDQRSVMPTPAAYSGICPLQCNTLTLYIIIFSVTVLIHSTSEVGSMLLTLRCVEPRDKAMALGFLSFATGLFGNVPCPIIYGTIIDSTCLFWEEDCGKRGACRLYDSKRFRQSFHGLTAFIMFLAFLIDLIVCYKANAIKFHEKTPVHDKNENQVDEPNKLQPDI